MVCGELTKLNFFDVTLDHWQEIFATVKRTSFLLQMIDEIVVLHEAYQFLLKKYVCKSKRSKEGQNDNDDNNEDDDDDTSAKT